MKELNFSCFYFKDCYVHQGKMQAYSLIILFCCACMYTTVDIMPGLKRNILNLGYVYEGMLLHSFDRFHVVTKFILPTIQDITILPITFDMESSHSYIKLDRNTHAVKHVHNRRIFC